MRIRVLFKEVGWVFIKPCRAIQRGQVLVDENINDAIKNTSRRLRNSTSGAEDFKWKSRIQKAKSTSA